MMTRATFATSILVVGLSFAFLVTPARADDSEDPNAQGDAPQHGGWNTTPSNFTCPSGWSCTPKTQKAEPKERVSRFSRQARMDRGGGGGDD